MPHLRLLGFIPAVIGAAFLTPSRQQGRVTAAAPMVEARAHHTATLLLDGRVLVAGGMVENGVFLRSLEVFDPANGRFLPMGAMATARVGHSATLLQSGQVLLAGGLASIDRAGGRVRDHVVASAELFDPATGKLVKAEPLGTGRNGHEALRLPDGGVILFGGTDGQRFLDSVERFDSAASRFVKAGTLLAPRLAAAAVLLDDGTVLITGGASGSEDQSTILDSAEIFDPRTGRSTPAGTMAVPRYKHAALRLRDGRVLIAGGSDSRDWHGVHDTAEIFDPKSRTFAAAGKMTMKRFKLPHAAALLPDGNALVAGGNRAAEIFDVKAGRFVAVEGAMGEPKLYATATLLRDGRVLIAGGYGNGSADRGPLSSAKAWLFAP